MHGRPGGSGANWVKMKKDAYKAKIYYSVESRYFDITGVIFTYKALKEGWVTI